MLLDRYLDHRAEREIDTELYRRIATATLAEVKQLVAAGANPDAPAHNDFPTDVFGIMEQAVNPKTLSYLDGLPEFQKQKFISWGYTKENLKNAKITNAYQCVPVKNGLDIMTINGARFMGIDKERGSIEVGKYADFIFADQNVLKCSLDDIHKTKVEQVFFEGEEVYNSSFLVR